MKLVSVSHPTSKLPNAGRHAAHCSSHQGTRISYVVVTPRLVVLVGLSMLLLVAARASAAPVAPTSLSAKPPIDDYPLTTCIVMKGQKLGQGGKGLVVNYEGREVRLCCKKCVKDFNAAPQKFLPILDAAVIAKEKSAYPLTTCVVTARPLGSMGEGVDFVYKNHLVRFCCDGCKKTFLKEPEKYMAAIENARRQRGN